jgi:hypothetical protein
MLIKILFLVSGLVVSNTFALPLITTGLEKRQSSLKLGGVNLAVSSRGLVIQDSS